MKNIILLLFVIVATSANAQLVSGAIVESGRKILGEPTYEVTGMKDGWATYELTVDIEGKVTAATIVESNLKSTPATTIIRNHVKKFRFEKGTYYPKFHHVIVKITMVKGKMDDPQIELD